MVLTIYIATNDCLSFNLDTDIFCCYFINTLLFFFCYHSKDSSTYLKLEQLRAGHVLHFCSKTC